MKILLAEYIGDYKMNIKFSDGTEGIVDMKEDLEKYKETRFYTLMDKDNFKRFMINDNSDIEWYNGWDYCKDTLYMKIKGVNVNDEKEVKEFLKAKRLAM